MGEKVGVCSLVIKIIGFPKLFRKLEFSIFYVYWLLMIKIESYEFRWKYPRTIESFIIIENKRESNTILFCFLLNSWEKEKTKVIVKRNVIKYFIMNKELIYKDKIKLANLQICIWSK